MAASKTLSLVIFLALGLGGAPAQGASPIEGELLPTGQRITPMASTGAHFESLDPELPELPDLRAGEAVGLARSPDGRTLLVLTSGYNRTFGADGRVAPQQSREYVFVYDIGDRIPVKRQVLRMPNAFEGIAWDPAGAAFYVSGGVDDIVHVFRGGAG